MAGSFLLEKEDRIATLIFNRPEKRNPLNEEVVLELEGLLHQVRDDRDVRGMYCAAYRNDQASVAVHAGRRSTVAGHR